MQKSRSKAATEKRHKLNEQLDKLWDIGASDAIEEIKKSRILSKKDKHEDIAFYEDQRGARLGSMSGSDKVYASNKRKQNEREERTQKVRRGRTDSSPSQCSSKSAPDQEPDGDSPESEDGCWTPNRAGTSSP